MTAASRPSTRFAHRRQDPAPARGTRAAYTAAFDGCKDTTHTMADFDFDLFVIGGGSGGVRCARMAASLGAEVAVAEEAA